MNPYRLSSNRFDADAGDLEISTIARLRALFDWAWEIYPRSNADCPPMITLWHFVAEGM